MTFDDVLAALRPYKGQFGVADMDTPFGEAEVYIPSGRIRHKSRLDADDYPACPLCVLVEDRTGRRFRNWEGKGMADALGLLELVRAAVFEAADEPGVPFRSEIEEALL
jgi:hypothetical protein